MTSKIPVSAVLITHDAEAHLDRVLASVEVCDEVVVLDSGSTDLTCDIAHRHGCRWYEHPFDSYGEQKRRAVALASHHWVLSVDADEVVDDEAAAGLAAIDWRSTDLAASWRIRRRTFIGDREIRWGHWSTERPVRLFNRLVTSFEPVLVHESVPPTSDVRRLPGSLLHYSYADLSDVIRLDYHRLKAVKYRRAGRRAGATLLLARALWAGLHSYLIRSGWREGGVGVVIALAAAVNATMGLAIASEPDATAQPQPARTLRPIEDRSLRKSA
jgi:glycosyltransferase involved in cell wall biosynthesis